MDSATPPGARGAGNELGLISMILGALSLPLLACFPLGVVFWIAAIPLGVLGRQRAARGAATNPGQALAGLICGVLAALVTVVLIARPD
jgi:hypothetical protein